MRKIFCYAMLLAAALGGFLAIAGDDHAEGWDPSSALGENHAWLTRFVGDWDYHLTATMDPNAPPVESTGRSRMTMMMDGRYLQEEIHGDFMGLPFEGRGITGFDAATGQFVSTWIDNFETGIGVMRGGFDADGRLVMEGEHTNAETGKTSKVRGINHAIDADNFDFEYQVVAPDGSATTTMRISYSRRGKRTVQR